MAKHFSRILPVGFGFVLLLFIFWPLFAGFTFWANGISYSDFWLFNFPLKDWYRSLLLQGELPFWTSLLGNGYPVFAEGQIGALYPFNLLFFRLFPTVLAINLTLFFHFFLAFFLTFLFCRVSLKLSQSAAFLAGLTFSLSGYFWIHIQYTNVLLVISWLPLVFLSIERIVMTKRFFWTFILALIFSLQILAGHLEFFLYSFLLSIFYFLLINFLFRGKDQARPALSLFLFAGAVILSIGITLVQTLPTYELTKESNRAGGFDVEYASSTSWPPKTLSFFLSPQFYDHFQREQEYHPFKDNFVNPNALYGYIGFLPIVLAILAMVLARKRFVAIFTILLFLAFIYGLGRQTQVFEILWQTIPGLKFLRFPVKILFFIEFCLAVLAGLGLDYLKGKISGKFKKITKIGLILGTTIVLATAADLYFNNAGRFSKFTKTDQWLQAPPTAQFLKDNLGQNYRYYTQSTNNLFAPGSDFTLHKSFQNILPVNFNLIYKIPSNREYFTLFLSRQKEIENQRTAFDSQRGKLELTQ
ncbi:MAG: YfhO family protein, partial [bacterium]|nr:YfhO family protein [bacterium]